MAKEEKKKGEGRKGLLQRSREYSQNENKEEITG